MIFDGIEELIRSNICMGKSALVLLLVVTALWWRRVAANMRFPAFTLKGGNPRGKSSPGSLGSLVPQLPGSSKTSLRTRVVTDIDDTVKSSGGVNIFGIALGGIDTQFKRGEFYPGVFQFLLELSKGITSGVVKKSGSTLPPEKVAVLTARAREFKFALALKPKDKLCTAFREVGKKNGVTNWGIGPVYYGSVAEWVLQGRKGIRKFDNFEKLMRDDRLHSGMVARRKYILVGDTGEKDEDAGERIIAKYPRSVSAVFLHVVSKEQDRSRVVLPKDRKINGVPILYFRTYVGAAQKAMQNRLITEAGLLRVVDAAREDLLKKIGSSSTTGIVANSLKSFRQGKEASKWAELEQDISSATQARQNQFRLSFTVNREL